MVWKPTISDVGIKLVAETGWAQPEIKIANTVVNEWEELTFDFSGIPNPPASEGLYDQIVIFPDFTDGNRGQENVIYFDNITFSDGEVGVSVTEADDLIRIFELNQNYPNPFNPSTNISYTLSESADVKLEVFNGVGQKVATLVNGVQSSGSHTVTFDASNLASGIYLYRLTSANQVKVNKMLLLK